MTMQLSMAARRKLIQVFGERHSRSDRSGKREILHDFVHLTVSYRQHAGRVLCREPRASRKKPGPRRGDDDEARGARTGIRGQRRRAGRPGSAVRRAMPIEPLRLKQFAPRCLEVVFIEHCGGAKVWWMVCCSLISDFDNHIVS